MGSMAPSPGVTYCRSVTMTLERTSAGKVQVASALEARARSIVTWLVSEVGVPPLPVKIWDRGPDSRPEPTAWPRTTSVERLVIRHGRPKPVGGGRRRRDSDGDSNPHSDRIQLKGEFYPAQEFLNNSFDHDRDYRRLTSLSMCPDHESESPPGPAAAVGSGQPPAGASLSQ